MSQVLVDSDVLINFLRQKENAKILLRKASAIGDICCSVISVTEIICGMRPEQEKITEELLGSLIIIPVSESIARYAGVLRKKMGAKKHIADCLIAATAILEQATLLTFNLKDYSYEETKLFPLS